MTTSGYATPTGTAHFFARHQSPSSTRTLGKTGLQISPIGFGGYRVLDGDAAHHEALRLALLSGCNLIDTSTNYGNGGSELLIGDVLEELILSNKIRRDEIVIVTKAGYVQGDNLSMLRKRAEDGNPFPETVEYAEGCWHNISPAYLEDQITRSLDRMQLDRIDVLLLHNPEYYLKTEGDHREYYRRIRQAFEHLEKEVERGRIQFYGISSNTFPAPRESEQYTSLESVWEIAEQISSKNHFAVIQFPMNLYEPGAALEENNSGKTVLQFAREKRLGTLVNRPLNAFHENKLIRLADFPSHEDRNVAEELKAAWTRSMELESAYPTLVDPPLVPPRSVAWGHVLRHNFEQLNDIDSWRNTFLHHIRPRLDDAFEQLQQEPRLTEWINDYREASSQLFDRFTMYLENQAAYQSDKIGAKLEHISNPLHSSTTLSQKALRVYLSLPGVDCVLVGMRQPEYVRDAMKWEAPISEKDALQALQLLQEP